MYTTDVVPSQSLSAAKQLPPDVSDLCGRLSRDLLVDGELDIAAVNLAIADIAGRDVAAACLAYRQPTNFVRVLNNPDLADVAADITDGGLVGAVFGSKATYKRLPSGELHVVGRGMMTTGVEFAAWFIVEARQAVEAEALLLAVPASGVAEVRRPTFIGLQAADNAVIDVDAVIPAHRVVGLAEDLIGLPYELGLTMGAIAVGAVEPLLASVEAHTDAEQYELGELRANLAAAAALVGAAPLYAPNASWWSKAAKVAATNAALGTCVALRRLIGAATYSAAHPLNRIEADLRGLEGQAPAHAGAARSVGGSHPQTETHLISKPS